jgi:hypothetical protein
MAKIASLLHQRFLKKEKTKMTELAEKSSEGQLSSFSGIFGNGQLDEAEKQKIVSLLKRYSYEESSSIEEDLGHLIAITSEVKSITNQAAILHGERLKKAQEILKKYRDGAFSAWLVSTYGNRQTPYNLMQYYDFYLKMPKSLHPQIELMPRQAIYTLASRDGDMQKKEEIVRNYKGETKDHLISLIRSLFPLKDRDKRRENSFLALAQGMDRLKIILEKKPKLTEQEQRKLFGQLNALHNLIANCATHEINNLSP